MTSNPTSRYWPSRTESRVKRHSWPSSKPHLCTVAKGGSTPCAHEWPNRVLSVLTMECCSALKRKAILTNTPPGQTLRTLCSVTYARHRKTNTVWVHIYEVPRGGGFRETESKMVGTRGRRGRESGEVLFHGGRVTTCKMEKFWRSAVSKPWIYWALWKSGKVVSSTLCLFSYN